MVGEKEINMTQLQDTINDYNNGLIDMPVVNANVQMIEVWQDDEVYRQSKNCFCKDDEAFYNEVISDLVGEFYILVIGQNGKHNTIIEQKSEVFESESEESNESVFWFDGKLIRASV